MAWTAAARASSAKKRATKARSGGRAATSTNKRKMAAKRGPGRPPTSGKARKTTRTLKGRKRKRAA